MEEAWKPIPGWEHYEVSSALQIRSRYGRLLKPFLNSDGYLKVNLSGGMGRRTSHQIGYFYLLAFVGPRPASMECCHRDDNKLNNDPANLYWGTHRQNHLDKVRNGHSVRGEKNGRSRLTEKMARKIFYAPGLHKEIAAKFGISHQQVWKIKTGKSWPHLKLQFLHRRPVDGDPYRP